MKLVDGEYQVVKGERVNIQIIPSVNLGNQIVAVRDSNANNNPFQFEITKDIGHEHFVKIVYGFLGAPDGSQYRVEIDGDGAGNQGPYVRFIRKETTAAERGYIFFVVP
jgi:hypothetical protein